MQLLFCMRMQRLFFKPFSNKKTQKLIFLFEKIQTWNYQKIVML